MFLSQHLCRICNFSNDVYVAGVVTATSFVVLVKSVLVLRELSSVLVLPWLTSSHPMQVIQ